MPGRPARRKSLAAEHPGDALVGRSVVADGSIFHQPQSRKFPGRVSGRPKTCKDRVHVIFDADETEYWFPIDLVKTWLVEEDDTADAKTTPGAAVEARTPGSAAAKVASALRRHSGLSLLGWGRAGDAATPDGAHAQEDGEAVDGTVGHHITAALRSAGGTVSAGLPAVSAAHVGWGAGAVFAVATVVGLISNYGMFHVRE